MYDFNFFEPYITKGRSQGDSPIPHKTLIGILLIILTAWPLFNLSYGFWINKETTDLKNSVTSNEKYQLLDTLDDQEAYISQLQSQLAEAKNIDKSLKDGEWFDEALFFSLLSTVPKDVQLNSVAVLQEKSFSIIGTTSNKPAIAEFEGNIRKEKRFDSLFVKTISNDEGKYTFEIGFVLKDGEN